MVNHKKRFRGKDFGFSGDFFDQTGAGPVYPREKSLIQPKIQVGIHNRAGLQCKSLLFLKPLLNQLKNPDA